MTTEFTDERIGMKKNMLLRKKWLEGLLSDELRVALRDDLKPRNM